jgi:hypothetical protein
MTARTTTCCVAAVVGLVALCGTVLARPACSTDEVKIGAWLAVLQKPRADWEPYLEQVKDCAAKDESYRAALDVLAVSNLQFLGTGDVEQSLRREGAAFVERILTINAEAGFASSQHNLAAMHNVAPGDRLAEVVDQNYETFMRWTCRAAAQREPRAILNLAVRTDPKDKLPFVIQGDDRITYRLLTLALENTRTYPALVGSRKYLTPMLAAVTKRLGAKETKVLDKDLPSFDFRAACRL